MSVLFPQRPNSNNNNSGVQTPSFQSAINPDSSIPIEQRSTRETAPGNEVEVIVLRPTIRPPSFEEVAANVEANLLADQQQQSPGRYSYASNQNSHGRNLPSPFASPAAGNNTLNSTYNNTNNYSSINNASPSSMKSSHAPAQHHQQHFSAASSHHNNTTSDHLVNSANNNNHHDDGTSKQHQRHPTFILNQENENNIHNNNNTNNTTTTSPTTSKRRQGSPRKLSCWTVGKNGENSIPTLKYRTIGDTVKGCLSTNDHRPLTGKELRIDWKRICALRAGQEIYKLRPPYVDREEFADPLRFTAETRTSGKPMVLIPSGYAVRDRSDGKWDHVPQGVRPTAKENVSVALKPTQINPLDERYMLQGGADQDQAATPPLQLEDHKFPTTNYGGELQKQRTGELLIPASGEKLTSSRSLREASAVPLNIPPSNPIIEEADRRLQQRGFGGLAQVGRASDEAVSHLLKSCGFPDAQRLVVLWEIRKAKNANVPSRR